MLPEGLWCALAGFSSARQGFRSALGWRGLVMVALVYPRLLGSYLSTYLSIPEVPTPLGLLSSLSGIAVSPV